MAEQSFLASDGLRSQILGSNADLAFAVPLTDGDPDPAAHTDASRIGMWYDRTVTMEGILTTVLGVDITRITSSGIHIEDGGVRFTERGAVPAVPGLGTGFLWMRNDNPPVLVYTDETSTDFVLNDSGQLRLSPTGTDNVGTTGLDALASVVAGMANNLAIGRDSLSTANSGVADNNTALGHTTLSAVTQGSGNVAVGQSSGGTLTTGASNVIIGNNADVDSGANGNATVLGANASVGNNGVALGADSSGATAVAVIGRGAGAGPVAAVLNDFVIGGDPGTNANFQAVTNIYAGRDKATANPQPLNFQPSQANGANIAGGVFNIRGGQSTGSADGGDIVFQVSPSGGAGSALNAFSNALTIEAADANLFVHQFMTFDGIAAPAVSSAGEGRIYFDSTDNTFKGSENGGAYVDIIGGGGDFVENTASTTDATVTTVRTIAVNEEETYYVEAVFTAFRTDGGTGEATFERQAAFRRRSGGSLTQMGALNAPFTREDGSGEYAVNITVSSNNIIITVQGEAANDVEWTVSSRTVLST